MCLETGGCPPAVSPRESSLKSSGSFLTHCLLLLPPPHTPTPLTLLWVQCRGSGGRRPCPAGERGAAEPAEQTGLCVAAAGLFLSMIEHLHPSAVNGPAPFPASLASASPSPAVLDQPIHHTDWCPPINFPLFKLSKLVSNSTDYSQHLRAIAARPAERCANRDTMASPFRDGPDNACSPKKAESSRFLHVTLQLGGGGPSGTEELGGKITKLFGFTRLL